MWVREWGVVANGYRWLFGVQNVLEQTGGGANLGIHGKFLSVYFKR